MDYKYDTDNEENEDSKINSFKDDLKSTEKNEKNQKNEKIEKNEIREDNLERNDSDNSFIKINKDSAFIIAFLIIIIIRIGMWGGDFLRDYFLKNDNIQAQTEIVADDQKDTTELKQEEIISNTEIENIEEIGDIVDYEVTINDYQLDSWRIFYSDDNYKYVVYDGVLPNTLNIAAKLGLETDGAYSVFSKVSKNDLLNKLKNNKKEEALDYLLTKDLQEIGAQVKGGIDIEMWLNSWNAKGYTPLDYTTMTFSDGSIGYNIGKKGSTSINMLDISSEEGFDDSLYFPKVDKNQSNDYYGYWLASPSSLGIGYLITITDDGSIANNFHGFYSDKGIGIRPVIVIPKENIEKQGDEWEIKK